MKEFIRNFALVAHIDHGKSTLADRIIEICHGFSLGTVENQVLDSLLVEKERGITIKAQCVRLEYLFAGQRYILNMIDTPGHVDFSFEVLRSLEICDGVVLLIDATQGIEAQTISNCQIVQKKNLKVIPVLNKIDSKLAKFEEVSSNLQTLFNFPSQSILKISAKFGIGIDELLKTVILEVPCPNVNEYSSLQALIVDSWFDSHLGIVVLVFIKQGFLNVKDKVKLLSTGRSFIVESLGVFIPQKKILFNLSAGNIGFVVLGIKVFEPTLLGDMLVDVKCIDNSIVYTSSNFQKIQPKVYASFYPMESKSFMYLKSSLEKLYLNDSSFFFESEVSNSLGFGFRCGFLGTLHMEIIRDRLEKEFSLEVVVTTPSVTYECFLVNSKSIIYINNPCSLDKYEMYELREPIVLATICTPSNYVGKIISLCILKRGVHKDSVYLNNCVVLIFELPLNEVFVSFFSTLKSLSNGLATIDFQFLKYVKNDLTCLHILINGKICDVCSTFVHVSFAYRKGREIISKLKTLIPRQLFSIILQAAIGKKIIARETINSLRKNVLSKCSGGDITRKKKLLEKQKLGKRKLKVFGKINIPKSIFLQILSVGE